MHFRLATLPWNVTFDRVASVVSFTQASNSTLTVSISASVGIYTKTGSSLSLISSTSTSASINGTGTASSTVNNGIRNLTIPWSMSLSSGTYHLGFWSRTSTAGANATLVNWCNQPMLAAHSGIFGVASASSVGMVWGQGYYNTTFTTAMPNSVGFSQINANGLAAVQYNPLVFFTNGSP
jgi:hypothetical protein